MTEKTLEKRMKVRLQGTVQGVGFRPFVWRLANELGLKGWVLNGVRGVELEAEQTEEVLREFSERLIREAPVNARIDSQSFEFLPLHGYETFEIRESDDAGEKTALVLPDIATCPDCAREIFDPANRRFRYPFTNCTNCGPRYSIIERVPYDRPNTTMKFFPMCPECLAEYNDPANRRFYAQPNACPKCGPRLELWDQKGKVADRGEALFIAETILWNGGIVALKGLGGFQLLCDARHQEAVARLRALKKRPGAKPFAVMFPSLEMVKVHCEVSSLEEKLLTSREAPIVLLERKQRDEKNAPCENVAPGTNVLGVMLPYTPLHHLLMADLGFPIVATSGNLSDEPIVIDEREAMETLGHIADAFLIHDRGIVRHVDDSIVRVMAGKPVVIRRARGYAPLPIEIKNDVGTCIAAYGPDLKNTGAVLIGEKVFLTQHIGDMETTKAADALEKAIGDTLQFRDKKMELVVCDAHPDYASTRIGKMQSSPNVSVQHHRAHVLSCMAENGILYEPALGVAWDGTGLGDDGTIWGSEFFRVGRNGAERVAHIGSFGLLGGDAASRVPKRSAISLLWETFGDRIWSDEFASFRALSPPEKKMFPALLKNGVNVFRTTSMGRLFDAVASILDLCHASDYEGHAAVLLEQSVRGYETNERYGLRFYEGDVPFVFRTGQLICEMQEDLERGVPKGKIAAKFHNTLAEIIVYVALRTGRKKVALSGGCFQNKYLLERTNLRLIQTGHTLYFHQNVPSNDGGVSLGQIAYILHQKHYQER